MKAVIQRVSKASVTIDNIEKRETGKGIVVLLAVSLDDTEEHSMWMAEKILNLRIFSNHNNEFDRSVTDVKGDVLVISQFTLYGNCMKGRRPDFVQSASAEIAKPLYNKFIEHLKQCSGVKVVTGEFQSHMLIEIQNDGPVTFIIEK